MPHPRSLVFLVSLAAACGGTAATGAGSVSPSSSNGGPSQGSYESDVVRGDEDAFTRRAVASLRASSPQDGCVYGGPRTIACGDAEVSLDRVWVFCGENPDECDAMVADFVDAMTTALAERRGGATTSSVEQLRVAVRPRDYGERVSGAGEGAIVRPIAGDLVAIVMVDSPRSARIYNGGDASALGLTDDAAYARALANTIAELPPQPAGAVPPCGQVRVLENDYYYESSRILDPVWLASLAGGGSEPILVGVPAYEVVFVARECDPGTQLALAQIGDSVARSSSAPLSATLFHVVSGALVPVR